MLKSAALSAKARAFPGLNHDKLEGTVLAAIINARVETIEELPEVPVSELSRAFEHRSLKEALSGPGRHFIFECKAASPTLGDINTALDFKALSNLYDAEAAAISVLCEPTYFKGAYENLSYMKAHTRRPVLCKDFVICERQIKKAYEVGADAVLLMCSVLKEKRLKELYDFASSLGLEAIVEVHTKEEADFAVSARFPIVGINNRNLKTLTIDFSTSQVLKFLLEDKERAVISESGVKSFAEVLKLAPFNNFLVGSAICAEHHPRRAILALKYGYNKICGLKDEAALLSLIENKAAIAGFVLKEDSPRFIKPQEIKALLEKTHAQDYLYTAGVFLDAPLEEVIAVQKDLHFDYLQLHGSESPEYLIKLKETFPEVRLIKALKVRDAASFEKYPEYAALCDLMLLDSPTPGAGVSFSWAEIPAFVDRSRTLLSGGLNLENIDSAKAQGFAGLDLSSGAESSRGVKDPAKVSALMHRILN